MLKLKNTSPNTIIMFGKEVIKGFETKEIEDEKVIEKLKRKRYIEVVEKEDTTNDSPRNKKKSSK